MIMMMMMKKVNDDLIKIYCDKFVHSKLSNFKINHALFIVRGFRETGTGTTLLTLKQNYYLMTARTQRHLP